MGLLHSCILPETVIHSNDGLGGVKSPPSPENWNGKDILQPLKIANLYFNMSRSIISLYLLLILQKSKHRNKILNSNLIQNSGNLMSSSGDRQVQFLLAIAIVISIDFVCFSACGVWVSQQDHFHKRDLSVFGRKSANAF